MNKLLNFRMRRLLNYAMVLCFATGLAGCASSKMAAPDLSDAQSNINEAQQAGAQQYAPLDLRHAQKKLDQAKALVKQEKYAPASRLVEEAAVDAKLAMVKTRSKKAQEAVDQINATIKSLKQEIKRKQNNSGG